MAEGTAAISVIHDRHQDMEGHRNDTGLADPTDNDKQSQAQGLYNEVLIVLDKVQSRSIHLEGRCTEQDRKILEIQTKVQQNDWLVAENARLRAENARLHTEVEQLRGRGIIPARVVNRNIQGGPDTMEKATVQGYAQSRDVVALQDVPPMRAPPARHVQTPPIQLPPLHNIQAMPQYAAAPQHIHMHEGSAHPPLLPSQPARPTSSEPFRHIESRHAPPALTPPLRSPNTARWLDPAPRLHRGRFDFMDPSRFVSTTQGDMSDHRLPTREHVLRDNAAVYPVPHGLPQDAHDGTVAGGQPVFSSTERLMPVGRVPQAQVQERNVVGDFQNRSYQGVSAGVKHALDNPAASEREEKTPRRDVM